MTFPEQIKDDIFYLHDLPNKIKELFNNMYYSKHKKSLIINKNKDCKIEIKNIKSMYYHDDIFYIKSNIYTVVFWEDIQKWQIIKSV